MPGGSSAVAGWKARGRYVDVDGHKVFAIDVPAAEGPAADAVLILHGFPTCSFDWRRIVPALRADRRVVLLDFPGFGLSDKPDRRYSIRFYADATERVVDEMGGERFALLTHDMGDTVGGELLARDMEGTLPFEIGRRVLTNGSIYIEMAQLTAGQRWLLGLADERVDISTLGLDPREGFRTGLGSTFAPSHAASDEELDAQWELAERDRGHTLLARTIRYIEDRRAEERRFTGAIEAHPSPLGVIWGALDPVAVYPMTDRLLAARPDAKRVTLDDVGHYPMVEAPAEFAAATRSLLDES